MISGREREQEVAHRDSRVLLIFCFLSWVVITQVFTVLYFIYSICKFR